MLRSFHLLRWDLALSLARSLDCRSSSIREVGTRSEIDRYLIVEREGREKVSHCLPVRPRPMVAVPPPRPCHDSKSQLRVFLGSAFLAESRMGTRSGHSSTALTDPLGECRVPEGKGYFCVLPSFRENQSNDCFMDMRATTQVVLVGIAETFTQTSTKRGVKHEWMNVACLLPQLSKWINTGSATI